MPVLWLRADVAGAFFLCLTVPPDPPRGTPALLGDLLLDPTDVELAGAGCKLLPAI